MTDYTTYTPQQINEAIAKRRKFDYYFSEDNQAYFGWYPGGETMEMPNWATSMDASQELMQEMVDAGIFIIITLRKFVEYTKPLIMFGNEKMQVFCTPEEEPVQRAVAWLQWQDVIAQ